MKLYINREKANGNAYENRILTNIYQIDRNAHSTITDLMAELTVEYKAEADNTWSKLETVTVKAGEILAILK